MKDKHPLVLIWHFRYYSVLVAETEKSVRFKRLILSCALYSTCVGAFATPWIGALDPQLHHDLVTLTEYAVVDASVTSYPVPWRGIADQLADVDVATLPVPARLAATRLQHYLKRQSRAGMQSFLDVYAATDPSRLTRFDGEQAPSARVTKLTSYTAGNWSAQLALNLESGGDTHFDQSYLAYQYAGWVLSASAMDQWWGPAQGSSLILSNNARPVPSIALSRGTATASEHPWLRWLGPWYFTAQLGQMEHDRDVPKARLWKTRFTLKPFKGLELGASWAAMWGGEGQPDGFSDFIDVLTFRNECVNGLSECDPSLNTTKGNHIAGFDLKYTLNLFNRPVSVYAQRIGEDAVDGYRVTDNANLFGLSTYLFGAKVFIETSDTNIACNGDGNTATNCFYENNIYSSGYRRYNRAIGSTFDSDAKQVTLGTLWQRANNDNVSLSVSYVELNSDGQKPSPVLTEQPQEDLWYASGYYQTIQGDWQIKLGATLSHREFPSTDTQTDVTGYVHLRYALNY
ncbi:capsule assembly Wzi family protein [Alteromonas oceanisediminis]|uniref:capsule assembly Wzi family protein n=1 Tax=Alteromonas oceanisediminis TaxID=2836180 RepID=UPI001BD9361F|nr:capsule assembly Wzi family protein [Alteromonas oceanisediminis]MBT0586751.1 capsule assembly Wzi family protein [Alteromonas oceanisediminis]